MDIDAFVATNQYAWHRLEVLTEQARTVQDIGPDELDELVGLYQRTGSHLGAAQSRPGHADVGEIHLFESRLQRVDRLATALAQRIDPLDQHRAVEVVVVNDRRGAVELDGHQLGNRNLVSRN